MTIPRLPPPFAAALVGAAAFAAITAAAAPSAADPCKLLTDAEVRGVFPGAQAGKPERTREKYGIRACEWNHLGGSFALQLWDVKKAGDYDNELRGLVDGIVDPLKPGARKNVRYEKIAGVGDGALAVVEPANAATGVLTDAALLVTQRGNQLVELHSGQLARGDRAAALQAMTRLAKAAVGRL